MSDVLALCYHAVSPTWTATLSVTPELLEAQLTTLLRRNWRGATFRDAVARPPAKRTLVVTFDDAFLSVLKYAQPILARLEVPATVFVPTAFASARRHLQWPGVAHWTQTPQADELECMSWSDLKLLVDEGWEVGSHTHTHPRLPLLDDEQLRFELEHSKQECTRQLGVACETLAYPYGDVDERVTRFAAAAGYAGAACLSSNLRKAVAMNWPRVGVYHGDDLRRFRLKVAPMSRRIRASRVWPAHE
jgi:peptidoglycan/xylan/chitin deacetylase (PgdA/CDA1 family)